jgi:hypothetical protein
LKNGQGRKKKKKEPVKLRVEKLGAYHVGKPFLFTHILLFKRRNCENRTAHGAEKRVMSILDITIKSKK